MSDIVTTHDLAFEIAKWLPLGKANPISDGFLRFRVGTVTGVWTATHDAYEILGITNEMSGNGHLDDVFEWFEFSCKRDNKKLRVLETTNKRFRHHLIDKRGFVEDGPDNVVKTF